MFINMRERDIKGRFVKRGLEKAEKKAKVKEEKKIEKEQQKQENLPVEQTPAFKEWFVKRFSKPDRKGNYPTYEQVVNTNPISKPIIGLYNATK